MDTTVDIFLDTRLYCIQHIDLEFILAQIVYTTDYNDLMIIICN
jgi:hypothetical protein